MANITLAVTGSIAAYRALDLVRALQREGHTLSIILTEAAEKFVTPLAFESFVGNRVYSSLWDGKGHTPFPHITLAKTDLFVIAPATAATMACLAHGHADSLVSASFLASTAPKLIVPAMNPAMYANVATQRNMELLRADGVVVFDPEEGVVACGDEGKGRFPQIPMLLERIEQLLQEDDLPNKSLAGTRILITAGGTREHLDPVRYLGNSATGTVGCVLARAAAAAGAEVTLVCAGCSFSDIPETVAQDTVISARELSDAVLRHSPHHDVLVMAAAVADFTPATFFSTKLKKHDHNDQLSIQLERTQDILKQVAKKRADGTLDSLKLVIGFAAETDDFTSNAQRKLTDKHLDLLVLNKVPESFGQGSITYQFFAAPWCAQLIKGSGAGDSFVTRTKEEFARELVGFIGKKFSRVNSLFP